MRSRLGIILCVILLLIPVGAAYADDPIPGTPEDNACFPGGLMEGKCDTAWEWECGYYLQL